MARKTSVETEGRREFVIDARHPITTTCDQTNGPRLRLGERVEVVEKAAFDAERQRADRAEAELRRAEAVLVAADRVREAYDAMTEGRDVGRLAEWSALSGADEGTEG